MNKDYLTPVVLFIVVVAVGLLGHGAYSWWYPRWQRNIAEEALRQLHIALEERFLEVDSYPKALDAEGQQRNFSEGYTLGVAPWNLLPEKDLPTRVLKKAKSTVYCSDGLRNWILAVPGPDGRVNTDLVGWIRDATGDPQRYRAIHPEGLLEYDPTNGAVSLGDILRTGP